jgi:hypothetical protein
LGSTCRTKRCPSQRKQTFIFLSFFLAAIKPEAVPKQCIVLYKKCWRFCMSIGLYVTPFCCWR